MTENLSYLLGKANGVLIPTIFGFSILKLIFSQRLRLPILFDLGVSFGLGLGLLSQVMLLFMILKVPHDSQLINFLLLVSSLWILLRNRRFSPGEEFPVIPNADKAFVFKHFLELALISYVLALIIFILLACLYVSVRGWDSFATSTYNAKIIYYERGIMPLASLAHSEYPLLVPLSQAWVALNAGKWDDQAFMIIFALISLSYCCIHFYFLRGFVSRAKSLLGTFFLLSSLSFIMLSTIAYRDIFAMYYTCGAVLFMVMWFRSEDRGWLILSALFAGFMAFTKYEGLMYIGLQAVLLIYVLSLKKGISFASKVKYFFAFVFIGFSIPFCYALFQGPSGVYASRFEDFFIDAGIMERASTALTSLNEILFRSLDFNILWVFLAISIILNFGKKNPQVTTILLVYVLLFLSTYCVLGTMNKKFFTSFGLFYRIDLSRLILHVFPLCPILIILLNFGQEKDY
ncbi:MAG: glycosyltransferase family 39 protein [Candidatus Omnitrophica bacterium]|nr:glycosyltransferase family 39 protein [Candidatus Omnitrophota bacterium]